ncbi:hypothetical protein HK103_005984 [Boothiomyces macroporosus]|uniref:RPA43 OB domain-containing protein n=1 Tax=Boothiomyces macroporosus TaxID=261099 RepID=A0AAD5ULR9_9FUNG|nr:hypothetical protein HK103_005984 [Boothiomyces macroporosus]
MLEKVTLQLKVHLAPKFISNTRAGIEDYLDALLQKDAVIQTESPYMHFDIQVDFTVFSPKVEDSMIGVVNKVSPDHVGCLVYGLFNASIAREKLPGWSWDYEENVWTVGDVTIKPGSVVKFKAERFETCNDILSIHGSMLSDGTGIVDLTGLPPPPMAILPEIPVEVDEREGIVDPYADDTDYEKTPIRKKIIFKGDEDEMDVDTQELGAELINEPSSQVIEAPVEEKAPSQKKDKKKKAKEAQTPEKSKVPKEKSSEKKDKKRKNEENEKEPKKKKK